MTIVINCRFLTRPVTGVERFAEELVSELTAIRNDLVLVAPRRPALRRVEIGGVPIERIGRLTGHAWEQIDLRRMLRGTGTPLLVSLANTGPVGYRRQVVAVHDVTHRRHPEGYSWRFRRVYAALTPRLLRDSLEVVTVSDFSRRELSDLYPGGAPISIVPNAVGGWIRRGARVAPSSPLPEHFFLVVGSHNAHKNLATAYRAFRQYRGSGGTTQLVVVGAAHPSFAAAAPEAAEGSLLLGRVSDASLNWLYAHARAFIFPSTYEGFGIPPLEAQAAGAPVIASDIPAVREALDQSALFFAPMDGDALAAAMQRIDTDPSLRRRLIDAGSTNVARYSWSASADVLSQVIDRANSSASG